MRRICISRSGSVFLFTAIKAMNFVGLLLLLSSPIVCRSAAALMTNNNRIKEYRYFGYGSNVLVSTMRSLRRIEPIDATAAILPNYELQFFSAAFVAPTGKNSKKNVHGVMYTLSAEDFAKVGSTEGVPFAYRWEKCYVCPYEGNGKNAGGEKIKREDDTALVEAYTLVPSLATNNSNRNFVPPSSSYLGLIKEGAELWKFDQDYQEELKDVQAAKNRGFEGILLKVAEIATGNTGKRDQR